MDRLQRRIALTATLKWMRYEPVVCVCCCDCLCHWLNCVLFLLFCWLEQDAVKQHVMDRTIPKCEKCEGLVKPDIVFFGEGLPQRFFEKMASDFAVADALIVIGTSLTVHPFADLISRVNENVPRLLINREMVGTSEYMFSGPPFNFHIDDRDVFYEGNCDDGCVEFARLLGWEEDLQHLMEEEINKLPPSKAMRTNDDVDDEEEKEKKETKEKQTEPEKTETKETETEKKETEKKEKESDKRVENTKTSTKSE
eukprot:m.65867 g.65867  ORF g.65867 m.65867 type:complete len:254 (-) comp11539_c5_seq2:417-1178(-)